jgi:hypothetical protein|tara:strand:- start:12822 stop:13169 length:348 start_codon:yes stop_codon:yes gene_type:complete
MDTRLEKALEFSNYMTVLNSQKRIIREQYLENCMHYLNGGKFSVTRELVNFCHMLVQSGQEDAVLIDDNETPIKVDSIKEFLNNILDIYFTSSNEYLDKYNDLKVNRSVEGLVDL